MADLAEYLMRNGLDPEPEGERGFLLPIMRQGNKLSPAVPGILHEPYQSLSRLLQSYQPGTGDEQPVRDAANVAGAVMLPGLGLNALGMVPKGALGMAGGRTPKALPMDDASRMARAAEMGYSEKPLWRGDKNPDEYPGGEFFSRNRALAEGHAKRHGGEAREFRLKMDPDTTFNFNGEFTRSQAERLIAAVAKQNPEFAEKQLRPAIYEGTPPSLIYQALEHNTHDAQGALRAASFAHIDTGQDVLALTGDGIRLSTAKFNPADAASRNIHKSAGISPAPWMLPPGEAE
jgi:hypothetical protein